MWDWFWNYHNGALPKEIDIYKTEFNEEFTFDVIFKRPLAKNEKVIYFNGTQWKEVNF